MKILASSLLLREQLKLSTLVNYSGMSGDTMREDVTWRIVEDSVYGGDPIDQLRTHSWMFPNHSYTLWRLRTCSPLEFLRYPRWLVPRKEMANLLNGTQKNVKAWLIRISVYIYLILVDGSSVDALIPTSSPKPLPCSQWNPTCSNFAQELGLRCWIH